MQVSDIQRPMPGKWVKVRIGFGPRESEIIHGQVTWDHEQGRILVGGTYDFNYTRGDRVTWISAKPFLAGPEHQAHEAARVELAHADRLVVAQQHASLRQQLRRARIALGVLAALLAGVLVYEGFTNFNYLMVRYASGRTFR